MDAGAVKRRSETDPGPVIGVVAMSKLDEIVDAFDVLGDWEQRYQYLVELGEQLPALPAPLRWRTTSADWRS